MPLAEFSYNNKVQTSTGHSPFMALYGYHPHMGTNLRREVRNESAVQFATRMKSIREEVEASLKMVLRLVPGPGLDPLDGTHKLIGWTQVMPL